MDGTRIAAGRPDQVGRQALGIVEQDFQDMVGNETLVALAQRQHLGALQEPTHALRVLLLIHHSTLSFHAPGKQRAKERTPYSGILRSIWGRMARAQDRTAGTASRCNTGRLRRPADTI